MSHYNCLTNALHSDPVNFEANDVILINNSTTLYWGVSAGSSAESMYAHGAVSTDHSRKLPSMYMMPLQLLQEGIDIVCTSHAHVILASIDVFLVC